MSPITTDAPKSQQTLEAAPKREEAPAEAPIYYSPLSPDQGLLLHAGGEIINFRYGRMQTSDTEVIAALEKGVKQGRYFKADLPMVLTCGQCGLPWKNQKAYELHVRTHNVE
jgi:hypothetical protein